MSSILFLLGSGASVDSGLFTYRNNNEETNKIVSCHDNIDKIWESSYEIYHAAKNAKLGNTYKIIQELVDKYPNSTILTQNVDGLVNKISNANIIELHGNVNYMKCKSCNEIFDTKDDNICKNCLTICNPEVTLLDESLDNKMLFKLGKLLKISYSYVLVIGTSLQFSYLRIIINKCKTRRAQIIHINPDVDYDKIIFNPYLYSTSEFIKYKKDCNVKKNEIFINEKSSEGLNIFIKNYLI